MEIHKPKPVHSWREFLTELGTVVLGIIIAISLEQFVEYLHWHNEVTIARRALTEEIVTTDRFYTRRLLIAPCLNRRLDEDAARIRDVAANRKVAARAVNSEIDRSGGAAERRRVAIRTLFTDPHAFSARRTGTDEQILRTDVGCSAMAV